MSNLTIAHDGEERNYVALYLDGEKIADLAAYELDPFELCQILKAHGMLPYLEIDEVDFEFTNKIDFPENLSESVLKDDPDGKYRMWESPTA